MFSPSLYFGQLALCLILAFSARSFLLNAYSFFIISNSFNLSSPSNFLYSLTAAFSYDAVTSCNSYIHVSTSPPISRSVLIHSGFDINGPRQANLVLIAYKSSCSLIQAVSQEEPSDRKPDPWPL